MIPTKRTKRSGLSGAELDQIVQTIKRSIDKWRVQSTEEVDDEELSEVLRLGSVLDMLMTKADNLETYSFFGMPDEHMRKLNISASGQMMLKHDSELRAMETDSVGEGEDWSADGLYRHLCLLERLVPCVNEAARRLWINAFFFRVTFMLPDSSKTVLNIEQNVLPVSTNTTSLNLLAGFIDFTVISTTEEHASILLIHPTMLKDLPARDHVLFVTEAKGPNRMLASHIPHAIHGMYACAKHLGKTIIRGALTNGREWMFFVLTLNEDGNGGKYIESNVISLMERDNEVSREGSSLIAAIIAYWIQHSHEEIGSDDYFVLRNYKAGDKNRGEASRKI